MLWHARTDMERDFFNDAWLAFTGNILEEELGVGWLRGIHPQDRKRALADYRRSFARQEEFSILYRLRRFDGRYRQMVDRGNPSYLAGNVFDGYFGYCVDLEDALEAKDREQLEIADLDPHAASG